MPTLAALLPLGALVPWLVMVAVPVLILMTVWAAVSAVRILFPERPLPFEPVVRRRRRTLMGEAVPVTVRDIVEDQAERQSAAAGEAPGAGPPPSAHPLFDDLWLRRN